MNQPIHTMYGGAHLFKSSTCSKLGALAEKALNEHAPDAAALARIFGISETLAETVHRRVAEKLRVEPIEDYRIDFEDGFGVRSDSEEDAAADNAAREVTAAVQAKSLPKIFGIRVKSFHTEANKARALAVAKDIGLDMARLDKDMASPEVKATSPPPVGLRPSLREPRAPSMGITLEVRVLSKTGHW